ncbi:MAG: hypothetical protein WB996_14695 [Ignavibacteriaceae bacterium]
MKRILYSFLFLSFISFVLISFNCQKDVTKDNEKPELQKPDTIPPGQASISGEIVEIEPVSKMAGDNSPCSKAPCMAKVKIDGVTYGAGFPVLNKKDNITIKFNFTLSPTTKDLFPNMDESYPGLKVGDKFTALAGFVNAIGKDEPEFYVYGYSKK